MTTYTKSLATDFSGNIKCGQFHGEIKAEAGITGANLLNIQLTEDTVEIIFDGSLSAGEQTTLNTLIANHSPDNTPPKNNFYTYDPRVNSISSTSYQRLGGPFKYAGSDSIGTINYIEVISYKDVSPTSYSVRIYDKTNDQVIAEKTGITNTSETINDLGTISNIPTTDAVFEIQAKRVGGSGKAKNVYIEQVVIYYD